MNRDQWIEMYTLQLLAIHEMLLHTHTHAVIPGLMYEDALQKAFDMWDIKEAYDETH